MSAAVSFAPLVIPPSGGPVALHVDERLSVPPQALPVFAIRARPVASDDDDDEDEPTVEPMTTGRCLPIRHMVHATALERWASGRGELAWATASKKFDPGHVEWQADKIEAPDVYAALSALSDELARPRVYGSEHFKDERGHSLDDRLEALARTYKKWKRGRVDSGEVTREAHAVAAVARAAPVRKPAPAGLRRVLPEHVKQIALEETANDPELLPVTLEILETERFARARNARQAVRQAKWRAERKRRNWNERILPWEGVDGSVDSPIRNGRISCVEETDD